ncbi:MAG: SMC-Scp complex subunit ScpB [Thiomicrospira sp.]|jgi:segregation and condensation protein B|nr:SMC-Scp complex subunit ScpB [Thiomicrospira sp.]
MRLNSVIGALLFSSDQPLTLEALWALVEADFPQHTRQDVAQVLTELEKRVTGWGLKLESNALGYRIQVAPDCLDWVHQLYEQTPPRLSRALLETLVIIAHRQPITRAEIEAIRGVSVSSALMNQLKNYDWIKAAGVKEVPGHPTLWVTTPRLLQDLGLPSKQALVAQLDKLVKQHETEEGIEVRAL